MRFVFLDKVVDTSKTLHEMLFDVLGLNKRSIDYILSYFGLSPSIIVEDMDLLDLAILEKFVDDYFVTGKSLIDVRKVYIQNIKFSNNMRSFRYRWRLPANGQRTHTNAQTSKKRT